jgi:addiction module HigA family antidote
LIKNTKPLHPGIVLREVYMAEMGLNQTQLAKTCGCSHRKINEIINGKRGIPAHKNPEQPCPVIPENITNEPV